jgi:ribonuclease-3
MKARTARQQHDTEEIPAAAPAMGLEGHFVDGAAPLRSLSELEETLSYTFQNSELLKNALVHKSYLHDVPEFYPGSNERLEFLGDAVLGLIVSTDLFVSRPGLNEGELTALRGAQVRKNTLAELGEPLNLGEFLYMSKGEEAAGGRRRDSNLARTVEAVLGAVYLDGGFDAAIRVWHTMLAEQTEERLHEVLRGDYKSQLQQFTQAQLKLTPAYRLVGTSGPEHSKQFHVEAVVGGRVLAGGVGRNKQLAEQAAAQQALEALSHELREMGAVQELHSSQAEPPTQSEVI